MPPETVRLLGWAPLAMTPVTTVVPVPPTVSVRAAVAPDSDRKTLASVRTLPLAPMTLVRVRWTPLEVRATVRVRENDPATLPLLDRVPGLATVRSPVMAWSVVGVVPLPYVPVPPTPNGPLVAAT